jgi:hypothetical protein
MLSFSGYLYLENGIITFFRNVGKYLPDFTSSCLIRSQSKFSNLNVYLCLTSRFRCMIYESIVNIALLLHGFSWTQSLRILHHTQRLHVACTVSGSVVTEQ